VTPARAGGQPARRQTQLYASGVSPGCGGPRGLPGVPGQLRGPRSTGASPPAPRPGPPGSRWRGTPCCCGRSAASAAALCGRSLQNKGGRGERGVCVSPPGKQGRRRACSPHCSPSGPLLGMAAALLPRHAAEGTSGGVTREQRGRGAGCHGIRGDKLWGPMGAEGTSCGVPWEHRGRAVG